MLAERILITGSTGAFGRSVAREIIAQGKPVTLLIRAANDTQARERAEAEIGGDLQGVTVLAADLNQPNLGLPDEFYAELTGQVSSILHGAASTRFDLELEAARQNNLETTKAMTAFAQSCRRLDKFGYISTAYVVGQQTGMISETEVKDYPGPVNSYDQSKYEAETYVRIHIGQNPTAIYRPSLVVSQDSSRHHAAIAIMNLASHSLLPVLPGQPDDLVDLIDTQAAAEAVAELFTDKFEAGQTYNIASGQQAPTLGSLMSVGKPPETTITYTGYDIDTYREAVKELLAKRPELAKVYRKIDCFITYLAYPKTFDTANTTRALGAPMRLGNVLDILEKRRER